ncbi:MAG TPA: TetR/AcrR family transcriptional regulator [Solirubrobacterales bacterium]|nr:TetR/AcrR family transcriptional regulator [Solirubrobacterales bacterium]
MATRARLPTDERRRQLIAAGLELFATRPYPEVAMGDVAWAAGVSHGLAFHYFGDKRGLYVEVVRTVTDRLVAATAPEPGRTPLEQLYAGLEAHVDFAARYPRAYTAFVGGGQGADEEVDLILDEARGRGLRHVIEALNIDEPTPRLEIALHGWQGFTEAAITAWLRRRRRRRRLARAKLLDMLAAALSDALRAGGFELPAAPGRP